MTVISQPTGIASRLAYASVALSVVVPTGWVVEHEATSTFLEKSDLRSTSSAAISAEGEWVDRELFVIRTSLATTIRRASNPADLVWLDLNIDYGIVLSDAEFIDADIIDGSSLNRASVSSDFDVWT